MPAVQAASRAALTVKVKGIGGFRIQVQIIKKLVWCSLAVQYGPSVCCAGRALDRQMTAGNGVPGLRGFLLGSAGALTMCEWESGPRQGALAGRPALLLKGTPGMAAAVPAMGGGFVGVSAFAREAARRREPCHRRARPGNLAPGFPVLRRLSLRPRRGDRFSSCGVAYQLAIAEVVRLRLVGLNSHEFNYSRPLPRLDPNGESL